MRRRLVLVSGIALIIVAVSLIVPLLSIQTLLQKSTAPSGEAIALHTSGHLILDANNNTVYLRGIGRAGDLISLSGVWGGKGDAVYDSGQAWQTNTSVLESEMDQTFACYRDVWHVNMVRIFVPVDWWWQDTINPYVTYGMGPDQVMSYRSYIQLLVQQAAAFGIYVDFCPSTVLNYFSSPEPDGIPGSLGTQSLKYMHSICPDEMQAWRAWWTSVVENLGRYPNVIFEMWNEPDDGTNSASSTTAQAYFNYTIQSYEAIRAAGAANLIFLQWHMGLVPTLDELDWVPQLYSQLQAAVGEAPVNVVFTSHPYRRAPIPNLEWATTYLGVKTQLNMPSMVPATRSGGIDVPLVFNEMGVMADPSVYSNDYYPTAQQRESSLTVSQRMSNELAFWDAILRNAKEMGIGVCAYYWMQTNVWWGWEALTAGTWDATATSPTPSQAGQIFINDY